MPNKLVGWSANFRRACLIAAAQFTWGSLWWRLPQFATQQTIAAVEDIFDLLRGAS